MEMFFRKLVLFIMLEKMLLFVVYLFDVVYVDSYCYVLDVGVVIVLGCCYCLKEFCYLVWDIEGVCLDIYGNLVFFLD